MDENKHVRRTNLRLNPDKEVQNRAWQYLQAMEKTLPVFLAGCVSRLSQTAVITTPAVQQEPDEEPDWDFLGA